MGGERHAPERITNKLTEAEVDRASALAASWDLGPPAQAVPADITGLAGFS